MSQEASANLAAVEPSPLLAAAFESASRLLIQARLRVAEGTNGRFQPTGFPDQGAALYRGIREVEEEVRNESGNVVNDEGDRPQRRKVPAVVNMLLSDSAPALANWLEVACLAGDDYNDDCKGVPYVRVLDGHASAQGKPFLTSSVREPHRIASPYVLAAKRDSGDETFKAWLAKPDQLAVNKQRPTRIWELARKLFDLDPGCVLHGVFLEELDGRLRLPRLVSAYIEAANPGTVGYGGVYRGEVTAKDNIPFPRQEFTSDDIRASFVLHLSTLHGYGLSDDQERFLIMWALYKIDRFLHSDLRLRSACEFELGGICAKLDGAPRLWPKSDEIARDFKQAKDVCFPAKKGGTDGWQERRVIVLTYRSEIPPTAVEAPGLAAQAFTLDGFEGRASFEAKHNFGKKNRPDEKPALVLEGDWEEAEFERLKAQNQTAEGVVERNPAHGVVKKAAEKHAEALERRRKKQQGA